MPRFQPPFPPGTISEFSYNSDYYFLSNFISTVRIEYEGMTYTTVEHAYQAAKTTDLNVRKLIMACNSPSLAKKQGKAVALRQDWDAIKFGIMRDLLDQKFAVGTRTLKLLQDTGTVLLIEGNYWHDLCWGQCYCKKHMWEGNNHLGDMLMDIRMLSRQ